MWGTSTYLAAYCTSLRLPSDSPANHNRFPASGTGSTILLRKHTPSLSRRFRVLGVSWGGGYERMLDCYTGSRSRSAIFRCEAPRVFLAQSLGQADRAPASRGCSSNPWIY